METKLTSFSQKNLDVIENFLLYHFAPDEVKNNEQYEAMMKSAHDYISEDHVDGEDSPEARLEKEGYFIEWNGEHYQSVFPSNEAENSELHTTLNDALYYMTQVKKVDKKLIKYSLV